MGFVDLLVLKAPWENSIWACLQLRHGCSPLDVASTHVVEHPVCQDFALGRVPVEIAKGFVLVYSPYSWTMSALWLRHGQCLGHAAMLGGKLGMTNELCGESDISTDFAEGRMVTGRLRRHYHCWSYPEVGGLWARRWHISWSSSVCRWREALDRLILDEPWVWLRGLSLGARTWVHRLCMVAKILVPRLLSVLSAVIRRQGDLFGGIHLAA